MSIPVRDAAHLLRRAGFGGTLAQVTDLAGASDWAAAVDRLLDTSAAPAVVPPPLIRDATVNDYERWVVAVQWWIDRMATSPAPLAERMVLFWHNHFVSAAEKSTVPMMWDQLQLFRTGGLGDYHDLVQRVAVDPAMLIYLDNHSNVAGAENENFAREVMELFTMGNFAFAESDVISMARAWTGYGLTGSEPFYSYRFSSSLHDSGTKTLFGIARNWDGPAALTEIIRGSKRQVAAEFITAKLWTYFAYPRPAASLVTTLANGFIASGHDIRTLVRSILMHPEFRTPAARHALVRSPIEWFVAGQRALRLTAADTHPEWTLQAMGQAPFNPPDVSGWKQNAYWISTSATWARGDWAGWMRWIASEKGYFQELLAMTPADAVQFAFDSFSIVEPAARTREALESFVASERTAHRAWAVPSSLIALLLLSSDFQLA